MLQHQHWYNYAAALETELLQSRDEGKDVSALKEKVEKLNLDWSFTLEEDLAVGNLLDEFAVLEPNEESEAKEPSELIEIEKLQNPELLSPEPYDKSKLKDQIYGAWAGRIAGCVLGKPVENWHKDVIQRLALAGGNYPIQDYISGDIPGFEDPSVSSEALQNGCFKEKLTCPAPSDDDINYTILGLKLVEIYGKEFTKMDVAEAWLANLPALALCTAEHAAYRNILNHILPPRSASFRNPYREWIGAQIRGDFFGYINPGNPKQAAKMAFRDACISHTKNGIYGEMFIAAMIAKAAVTDNMVDILKTGMAAIPSTSRLHQRLMQILQKFKSGSDFDEVLNFIYEEYPANLAHNTVHTIPNAMIVAAALLYGEGDFTKTLGLSVMAGMDTDCNGATIGSVVGIMNGISKIDSKWLAPFENTFSSDIMGFSRVSLTDLAERTLRVMEF